MEKEHESGAIFGIGQVLVPVLWFPYNHLSQNSSSVLISKTTTYLTVNAKITDKKRGVNVAKHAKNKVWTSFKSVEKT